MACSMSSSLPHRNAQSPPAYAKKAPGTNTGCHLLASTLICPQPACALSSGARVSSAMRCGPTPGSNVYTGGPGCAADRGSSGGADRSATMVTWPLGTLGSPVTLRTTSRSRSARAPGGSALTDGAPQNVEQPGSVATSCVARYATSTPCARCPLGKNSMRARCATGGSPGGAAGGGGCRSSGGGGGGGGGGAAAAAATAPAAAAASGASSSSSSAAASHAPGASPSGPRASSIATTSRRPPAEA